MRWSFAAMLVVPTLAVAQAPAAVEPPFKAVSGALIALSVADIAASTKWYQEKLGLRITMQVPKQSGQPGVAILEGNGLLVELQEHTGATMGDRSPSARQGVFKAGIYVDDFDATLAALRTRGVEIAMGPFPKRDNQSANVIVRDNSGNYIQILGR